MNVFVHPVPDVGKRLRRPPSKFGVSQPKADKMTSVFNTLLADMHIRELSNAHDGAVPLLWRISELLAGM